MLGKLLKYELHSTARILLPLYPIAIIFAFLNKIMLSVLENSDFFAIPSALMMMVYVFLIAAIFVMTIVLILQRFYKNLLGEEGYLMFCLPVKTHNLILSKFISAIIWIFSSIVVAIISALVLVPDYSIFKTLFADLADMYNHAAKVFQAESGISLNLIVALGIAIIIFSVIQFIMSVYSAISIGHLANKNRLLCSFGAYVVIYVVMQSINATAFSIFANSPITDDLSITLSQSFAAGANLAISILTYLLISNIVFSIIHFFITRYLLNKKLNLE